jgi:hypothetical protein
MAGGPISRATPPGRVDETRWEKRCAGKDAYPSWSSASAVLAMIRREGTAWHPCRLQIYQCEFCDGWHLGNS